MLQLLVIVTKQHLNQHVNKKNIFNSLIFSPRTDPVWNLTTVEEGYTFVASEGAAKLARLSSTR